MDYPCLIPKWALNADVVVGIAGDGVNEDGELLPGLELSCKCNLQLRSEQALDNKHQKVRTSGKAYFIGDICPGILVIKGGTLTHNGVGYKINAGSKALNFDGSVNYTALELV